VKFCTWGGSTLLRAEGQIAGKQLLRKGPGCPGRHKLTMSQKWSLEAKKANSFLSHIQKLEKLLKVAFSHWKLCATSNRVLKMQTN